MFSKYIGLPYSVANCWELVAKIQSEQFGISLPLFQTVNPNNTIAVAKTIAQQKQSGKWSQTVEPKHGAVVLLQRNNTPTHAGIYINIDGQAGIIHTSLATGCVFNTLSCISSQWNIAGYYMPVKGEFNDA